MSLTAAQNSPAATLEADLDLATETLYRFLAAALSDPRGDSWSLVLNPENQRLATVAAEVLRDEFAAPPIALGFGELPSEQLNLAQVVMELARPPHELGAEYVRVFGLATCRECPPYETEFCKNEEIFYRSQQMADVAGFYRAFGLEPGSEPRERPDHLCLELEFMSLVLLKKRLADSADDGATVCQEACRAFMRDHLSWWAPSFAVGLRRKAEQGLYAALGQTLAALLPVDRARLGVPAPMMPLEARVVEAPDECSGCLVDVVELKC
ncbi:MAG: molecular chaperone TorD family protein [Pirellulales bacterium]|nr:molecular chaperone TorD family protein [Pirellulales bacterium]